MPTLRVFLSSPGDVAAERDTADAILSALHRSVAWRGKFGFEIVRWDDPHAAVPTDARLSPQDAINRHLPTPSQCDIVAVILWSRMGTPLDQPRKPDGSQYLSGTEWEYEDARNGAGHLLLFRRTDPPAVPLDDPAFDAKRGQYQRVKEFFEQFTGPGGSLNGSVISYSGVEGFGRVFQQSIEGLLRRIDGPAASADSLAEVGLRAGPSEPPLPERPYPLLQPYWHPRTFAGRDEEVRKLESLVREPQLVLCLHAASGAGKSSLLLAGLAPRLRQQGFPVHVARHPSDPELARRILLDLLELPPNFSLGDNHPQLPVEFARWVAHAHGLAGKPPVLIVDQLDDVLRHEGRRERGLARLGPLVAATALPAPGLGGVPCRWVLCYRHEFHGEVVEWLQDVLEQARRAKLSGIAHLPHDLSDPDRQHGWAVPVMGAAGTGNGRMEAARRAFLSAILTPLEIPGNDGAPHYRIRIERPDAERLAEAFARARQGQPEKPLVPELQVVLNHLLESAPIAADGTRHLSVPADEAELDREIGEALAGHLRRALEDAFPLDRNPATGRTARAEALNVLRELADQHGRRGGGLTPEALAKALGPNGDAILDKLAHPSVRLLVREKGDEGFVYTLSHDKMAEVVAEFVEKQGARKGLEVDERVFELRRFVAQRTELYLRSKDYGALALTGEQYAQIESAASSLMLDDDRRRWWAACVAHRKQRQKRWGAVAALTAAVLLVSGLAGWLVYSDYVRNQREQLLRERLTEAIDSSRLDYAALVGLASDHRYQWSTLRPLEDAFLARLDPKMFARESWSESDVAAADLLQVIERSHRLFVPSREFFGAMSFALEELFLRSADAQIKERARRLFEQVRTAFIAHHTERTPGFQAPPARPEDDPLNVWVGLPPGEFVMGSLDGDERERPTRTVHLSGFSMQQHEVTNEEYRRFDPSRYEFPEGQERHPVASVNWYEAAGYAAWLGASLPTEAQWEYAARGAGATSGRTYPWGDPAPDASRAVYRATSTMPVGSLPAGRTPEEIDDMAGNVWEWCRDWYAAYPKGDETDPLGPIAGNGERVLRGGSFLDSGNFLRAASRYWIVPGAAPAGTGFRVVSSRFGS